MRLGESGGVRLSAAALLTLAGLVLTAIWFSGYETPRAGAQAPCTNGTVISEPADHPELVADCEALLEAKDPLRGTAELNWSAERRLTSWQGVTVGMLDGVRRVTRLNMDRRGLTGTIPAALGRLTGLWELRLAWRNSLTGSIPAELGGLTRLTYLNLAGNRLTGAIPPELDSIGPQLTKLILSGPRLLAEGVGLSGAIPAQLGNLTGLEDLYLDGNRLSGSIPTRLGRLTNLVWLYLARNQLSGSIPTQLGNLTNLTHLLLERNALSGQIPSQLGGLRNLRKVYLKNNAGFTGCAPPRLSRVRQNDIDTLGLSDCATDAAATPETPLPTFTLTASAGAGGSVEPSGTTTHSEASSVTLTASWNDATHTFAGWSGACAGMGTTCQTVGIYSNLTVEAAFTALPAERCASPTAADCLRAVYEGAPGDYAQVQDIPADKLLLPDSDGRYRVERGVQYTVVSAAPLPTGYDRFYPQLDPDSTPRAVSFFQLIRPVGTTYTFTVNADEGGANLFTYHLYSARTSPSRPNSKPSLGAIVATTVFRVASCASGTAVSDPSANAELVADCERLIGLRDLLSGSGSLHWDVRTSISGWSGVTLGGTPKRVTQLNLATESLDGELSGLLGDLDGLTQLRLNGNALSGPIPSKLTALANLTHLYLAGNSFSGCLPADLKTVANNDLSALTLADCGAPTDISYGEHTLASGAHEYALVDDGSAVMFDVPAGLNLEIVGIVLTDSESGEATIGLILRDTTDQSWLCVDLERAEECYRKIVSTSTHPDGIAALLDRLAESIWMDEGPWIGQTSWRFGWPFY